MSASLPESVAQWYEDTVRRFGRDHRALGFRTRAAQERRFEALLGLGDFEGARLLDAGCGFGDFLDFLCRRGIASEYTGVDICAPMIDRCRERFAEQGRFIVGDMLEFQPERRYDYVVASGIFGLDSPGARDRIAPMLEHLFECAEVGLAVNFLSARSPAPAEARVYVDPAQALGAALELTPAVRLDHAYLPNDFTLCLYRDPAWLKSAEEPA